MSELEKSEICLMLSRPIRSWGDLLLQFSRYAVVGGVAFIIDFGVLYLLFIMGTAYLTATALGFIAGWSVNFILSKRYVFRSRSLRTNMIGEFLAYGLIGLIGLGLTEIIVFVATDWANYHVMASKCIASATVLLWNFFGRKIVLY